MATSAAVPYSPAQIRHAYGFDQVSATGMGQKIAIVDAYGNQNIQSDLDTFCKQFGLKSTTVQVIGSNFGGNGNGWDLETSLDVQWAHVVAPDATIVLSVAPTESIDDLLAAIDAAVAQGANVVSLSWGAQEWSTESDYDSHFNVLNVCFVASSGDNGELKPRPEVQWPAVSPYVIGVGGTSLYLDASGNRIAGPSGPSEVAWSSAGGGLSSFYSAASWQSAWLNAAWPKNRGVPDVSYVADPNTGLSVYCSTYSPPGWYQIGGTSAGAPQWAALITLANQWRTTGISGNADIYGAKVAGTPPTIQALNFRDISSGSNGSDADDMSVIGFDLVTGLGSPVATGLIPALANPPVVTAPAGVTIACTDSLDPSVNKALGTATAVGGCNGTSTPTYSDRIAPGNCPGNYAVSRTWTSQDACGNTGTALQTITVQDTTPPSISAPSDLVLSYTADASTNSTGAATAQDGCSGATVTYSDAAINGADGSQIITRTWVATDACSNIAHVVQTITLNAPLGLILPTQNNLNATDLFTLTVTNTATDPNGINDTLSYQLISPPAGMAIDNNGIITWTPTLDQSPSTNIITTVVTTTVTNSTSSTTISTTNSFVALVTGPYDGLDMLADSDGDGVTNLVESAVGGDLLNAADGNDYIIRYITEDSGSHFLAMTYKARNNATALQLQYLPEVSADEVTWYSDTSDVLGLSVTPADTTFSWVTVRDTTPITPTEARFIRLHVIWNATESFSPIWIGTDTLLQGNNLTLFSKRMIRPILGAGTVASTSSTAITDTNATFVAGQYGNNGMPAYVELHDGRIVDIANTSPQSLELASTSPVSVGDAYRIRAHFTIASMFGTNNETGLLAGPNPGQADNVLLFMAQTQQTLTLFFYSNAALPGFQGWVRADTFSPDPNEVIYPEQGVMVQRVAPSNAHLYMCGPIKTDATIVTVQPGYNLLGTLKSLSSVTLSNLNLYTGSSATGMVGGLNPSMADNLVVVEPDGSLTTYFYYNQMGGYQGWINASGFLSSDGVAIAPGSTFFINRAQGEAFSWTDPKE